MEGSLWQSLLNTEFVKPKAQIRLIPASLFTTIPANQKKAQSRPITMQQCKAFRGQPELHLCHLEQAVSLALYASPAAPAPREARKMRRTESSRIRASAKWSRRS